VGKRLLSLCGISPVTYVERARDYVQGENEEFAQVACGQLGKIDGKNPLTNVAFT